MVKQTGLEDLPEKENHQPNTEFEYEHPGAAALALRMPSAPLKIEGNS